MIGKNIDKITEEDLQALVDNSVLECKTIEYKQALPSNSDSDKKEFLADVSSFANAGGGDIIYGIIEDRETGTPKSVEGLIIENIDQEILRLDNIIRTGIQPRLTSVTISPPIPLENSKVALIIRIAKSWISPHHVIHNDKFYSRSSNGKYPLDVGELRIAFNLSETITERIRNFRLDRISKIVADETPVPFYDTAKIVLHLIPIISFNPAQSYDIGKIASNPGSMLPMGFQSGGLSWRYNLDGFLTYVEDQERKTFSYVQFFRNGIIEAVDELLLQPPGDEIRIFISTHERNLIKSLTDYLSILGTLNVEPPILVFVTLLGVKGYRMVVDYWKSRQYGDYPFDRDILLLPEAVIENYDGSAEKILRPCFDSIWNACGFPRDLNYNENGEWAPKG